MAQKKPLWIVNAGRLPYGPAYDLQREIVAARKTGAAPDVLLFCEHPHVITLGRNGQKENLLADQTVLKQMNVEFHETDRGGDITYHGPGQIVGYPILDLTQHKRDVRWYVEQLEEVMIRTAADYGLSARRILCRHGIWIAPPLTSLSDHGRQNVATERKATASAVPKGTNALRALAPEVSLDVDRAGKASSLTESAPLARHNLAQRVSAGNAPDHRQSAVGATQASKEKCSTEPDSRRECQGTASAVPSAPNTEGALAPEGGIAAEEKLAALGVHLSRWVTSHGFAFNVSTDLRYFDLIVPCGIKDKRATSLERALGRAISIDEARARLTQHFAEIFHAEIRPVSLAELRHSIKQHLQSVVG